MTQSKGTHPFTFAMVESHPSGMTSHMKGCVPFNGDGAKDGYPAAFTA